MALAMKYVEATDPAKAQKIKDAKAKISSEVDPEKAKAALDALEKSLRTGDLFADMQVKAALTAYSQNKELYEQLKNDSKNSSGILDKNLAERRETSAQQWSELSQSVDDSMRSIGDAIRPATDAAAKGLTWVAKGIAGLSDKFPGMVMGAAGVTAAVAALITTFSAAKIGVGVFNVARGSIMGRTRGRNAGGAGDALPKTGNRVVDTGLSALGKVFGGAAANDGGSGLSSEPQRVFVVNASALGGGVGGAATGAGERAGSRRSRRRARRQGATSRAAPRTAAKATRPAAKAPSVPIAPKALAEGAGELAGLGKTVSSIRNVTLLAKRLPGGKVINAGMGAIDTAMVTAASQVQERIGAVKEQAARAGAAINRIAGKISPSLGNIVPTSALGVEATPAAEAVNPRRLSGSHPAITVMHQDAVDIERVILVSVAQRIRAVVRVQLAIGDGDAFMSGGHYGVVSWDGQAGAVSASAMHDNGRWSVADPRLPAANDRLTCVIQSLDGTWHRPFTTLEMAALQSLVEPEEQLELDGLSDQAWRERIGNAVPPAAAEAVADVMGTTLLLAAQGETFVLSSMPIWVRPIAVGLSVAQREAS